jgi:hypothetical protein
MSDLAISAADDDLLLIAGSAQLVTGADAVAQAWITHMTLFLGECFRDLTLGIDYQNLILIKNPSKTVLRGLFARASRETPGVQDVTDLRFAFEPRTRVLTVTASVTYAEGGQATLQLNETIGGAA